MIAPVVVAIDFETAGHYRHSACAIGMVRLENGAISDEFYSLVRPPSSQICFSHIHGLHWSDLKNADNFAQVWQRVSAFLEGCQYIVAHNARFDKGVLMACCEAFDCPKPEQPFLCTLKAARKVLPISKHGLNVVCDYFGYELEHHNALSDARACGRIFLRMMKMGLEISQILS